MNLAMRRWRDLIDPLNPDQDQDQVRRALMGPAGPPGGGGGGGLPNPIENWARRFGIHPGAAGVVATNSIHFCWNFCQKNQWFAWRANRWPLVVRETLFSSSQQLPCLCLGPLKGFLSWHGALQGPSPGLVCYSATSARTNCMLCRAGRHRRPRTLSKTTEANLDLFVCNKRTLLHWSLTVLNIIEELWPDLPWGQEAEREAIQVHHQVNLHLSGSREEMSPLPTWIGQPWPETWGLEVGPGYGYLLRYAH